MSEAAVGTTVVCSTCGSISAADARFCEECGSDLPGAPDGAAPAAGAAGEPVAERAEEPVPEPSGTAAEPSGSVVGPSGTPAGPSGTAAGPAPCRECGGVVAADGYCTTCGAKAPRARDHVVEQPQSWVAAVSDRGVRHHRNEDAAAVAADTEPGSRAVLVVCDGVSSSEDSDVASLAAARAAREVLVGSRSKGLGSQSALSGVFRTRLEIATDAASDAVARMTSPDHGTSPPSCTFVAAVVENGRVVVGVVGDSRAYWLPDTGEQQMLTVDDSWSAAQIAAGVPREQAEAGPQAHAITRWLGVDAPDHTPRVTTLLVDRPGWLMLCSDGLWNYCSPADELGALVQRTAAVAAGEPLALASRLVDWANAQGGHDNITVALARLGDPAPNPLAAEKNGES
ncbi:PP2C family serine/threonine-protein phosphatase [Pengzhenrongella sp.]|jgi:serine/threonine protein phosphatase PrpC|uniref:PP2C family serine/threonine-protein phosphatase n=1 Tax=Pengzhenrongella sp. TaxID=2888820 RepID=UPI002F94EBB2